MSRRSNNSLANGDQNDYASHQASAQVIKLVYSNQRELFGPNSCNIKELTSLAYEFFYIATIKNFFAVQLLIHLISQKSGTCLNFLNKTHATKK